VSMDEGGGYIFQPFELHPASFRKRFSDANSKALKVSAQVHQMVNSFNARVQLLMTRLLAEKLSKILWGLRHPTANAIPACNLKRFV
jgi:hypothetical protein